MKKVLSLVLTFSLLLSVNAVAFAEGTTSTLTDAQKTARAAFTTTYMDKMNQIVELRVQTKTAQDANNALSAQIKDKLKNVTKADIQEKVSKIKAADKQVKDLATQAKTLNVQRETLKKQYREAVQKRDLVAMKSLETQINGLTGQIEAIRTQVKSIRDSIKPIIDEVKVARDANKAKNENIKALSQQAKAIHQKIVSEEQAKNKLWESYKANIGAHDYAAATATLDNIIAAKKQILADIQAKTAILNQIITLIG
jgi:chromosome segregation ATPase